ncbi:MAG: nitroreductase family protein [Opitutaceae bacterium]|nr:nitroreductase family protein [Opitutaceae bacterium]
MDAIECINTRYSCRNYRTQPVPRALLEQLVDAGRRAPSGRKEEPVEFIVATRQADRDFLAKISTAGKFIAQAGACIVVIARDTTYYLEDGAAAVENALLAATALGLQSCWVAGDKKTYAGDILRHFGVPAGFKLVAMLAIGYASSPCRQPPHRPLAEVLHWEQF